MNIVIILVTSLVVFLGVRFLFIFLNWILGKIFNESKESDKFELGVSIGFYLMYIWTFLELVDGVVENNTLTNGEWYFVFTFIGISLMIWCYFSWDMKLKAKPTLELNEKQIIIKKILVFAIVMMISFVNGYDNMYKELYEEILFPEIRVLNSTMIVGVIALDRLLNQILNYKKLIMKKGTQKQENES